ncbi:MAG: ATP-grasp fold amidoligase family protein [Pseudomonadota bacterium]|nr:ATP-grasp fold amidoligase family protein [Pseudomonadota bacterium]
MTPKRKQSWLLLEWVGTVLFGILPDTRFVNRALSRIIFMFTNWFDQPNLKNPTRFNEKLMLLKHSDEARTPLRTRVTDKEFVKAFVTEKVGPGHVVPTLAILKTPKEVDTFQFPLPCVIKPTHSSQEVMIFRDRQPDAKDRKRMKYWLWKNYYSSSREPNYRDLDKKLIVEKVIGGGLGVVEDVKVMCFHGKPKFLFVIRDKFGGASSRDFHTVKGEWLPIIMRHAPSGLPFPHPDKLAELLEISKTLSAGFTFMRVDFYIADGQVLVGELTSFPTNCTVPFKPASADLTLARLFDEPDLELTPDMFEPLPDVAPHPGRVVSLKGAPAKGRLHEAGGVS